MVSRVSSVYVSSALQAQALCAQACPTPIGTFALIGSSQGLRELRWSCDGLEIDEQCEVLDEAAQQMSDYFAGTRTTFSVPLDLVGTPFQLRAWHALAEIPFGTTVSYADQASRIGHPTAIRAVGAANGRNPVAIFLPCHRIIGSDGSLTGFGGGLERKRYLLEHEASQLRLL
jgi:methylated-DNA-[protein]-cysteine S-methyltransferase